MIITRPASKIQQGNLRLFATSLRVGDLKVRTSSELTHSIRAWALAF